MGKIAKERLQAAGKEYSFIPISQIEGAEKLPYSLKVLLENVLRNARTDEEGLTFAARITEAAFARTAGSEVEFSPARVLFQDFTGVPVFVDFATMREACKELGGDPADINPQIPCDLVIDHSVIADVAGCPNCMDENTELEFKRNEERYTFLKWAQASFKNVRIVPPGQGICHQLNIEQFARVVMTREDEGEDLAYFDTVVGTDSHTPTANGIGVLGWGVGGIEAEAAALGQPITTLVPRVIGINLTGALAEGVAAMDVSLSFAQMLRERGVVGCFVECFGEGVASLSATQRAAISNMTPEYGCTCTLFPVDEKTIEFLRMTGRSEEQIALVEGYARAQGYWGTDGATEHVYSEVIEFDLGAVKPSLSGPSRPHDRFDLAKAKATFDEVCKECSLAHESVAVDILGEEHELTDGALAIAAVTSCTTATDPAMMLQAGLLARNAHAAGLMPKPWVKTIFAPGSHATEMLLERAGLMDDMRSLGFYTCGFGCMSCIGNSGPLMPAMHEVASQIELASVLSGNRNFEGRISPDVSQNYLTTPAHVIAYSLVGTMDFDPEHDPIGTDQEGRDVYLRDIEPDQAELDRLVAQYVNASLYEDSSTSLYEGDEDWKAIEVAPSEVFAWADGSTYVRKAPYFDGMSMELAPLAPIEDAYVLGIFDDFITTDHISPAGAIAPDSPAASYLDAHGVEAADYNTYGSRRGNHEVMARGTFANVKLLNGLAQGKRGGWTTDAITDEMATIFDVAEHYKEAGKPSIILAGKMYGSGSSRDWAAKGPMLLGVRAVIAESFERIHRSNLIGMGILPLQFAEGQSAKTLGLNGSERYDIEELRLVDGAPQSDTLRVRARHADGSTTEFDALVRIDTPTEGLYFENEGILQYVLRELA